MPFSKTVYFEHKIAHYYHEIFRKLYFNFFNSLKKTLTQSVMNVVISYICSVLFGRNFLWSLVKLSSMKKMLGYFGNFHAPFWTLWPNVRPGTFLRLQAGIGTLVRVFNWHWLGWLGNDSLSRFYKASTDITLIHFFIDW